MDILETINKSLKTLKSVQTLSQNIKNAELNNAIADLSNELADAKLAATGLKEEILRLREENAALRAYQEKEEKPDIKWGCYYFDGDETRLYCPTCYDTKGIKILTSRFQTMGRVCNNCKGVFK